MWASMIATTCTNKWSCYVKIAAPFQISRCCSLPLSMRMLRSRAFRNYSADSVSPHGRERAGWSLVLSRAGFSPRIDRRRMDGTEDPCSLLLPAGARSANTLPPRRVGPLNDRNATAVNLRLIATRSRKRRYLRMTLRTSTAIASRAGSTLARITAATSPAGVMNSTHPGIDCS